MPIKSRNRKLFTTLAVLTAVGIVGVYGTFAAFTATTVNTGNQISSGSVKIDQHAGYMTLYNVANQKPGQLTQKCVRVTYSGGLPASVKLYTPSTFTNGSDYTLTVERGSGMTTLDSTMSCAGFAPATTAFPAGDLGSFATTYAGGYDGKAAAAAWNNGDSIDYRFTITPKDDAVANNHISTRTSGTHSFVWEARSN